MSRSEWIKREPGTGRWAVWIGAILIFMTVSGSTLFSRQIPLRTGSAVTLEREAAEGSADAQFKLGDRSYRQWLERYTGDHTDHNPPLLAEAVQWLRMAADLDSAPAQFYLGYIYFEGHGRKPDYVESARWFEKAAGQGYADATAYLALQYAWGWGLKRDRMKARELFSQLEAAEPRSSWAIGALANAYYEGRGVKKDLARAASWYEKNARRGDVLAQYRLGQLLQGSKELEADWAQSYFWFGVAARYGETTPGQTGPNQVRWMVTPEEMKNRVSRKLSPEQIKEVDQRIAEWEPE